MGGGIKEHSSRDAQLRGTWEPSYSPEQIFLRRMTYLNGRTSEKHLAAMTMMRPFCKSVSIVGILSIFFSAFLVLPLVLLAEFSPQVLGLPARGIPISRGDGFGFAFGENGRFLLPSPHSLQAIPRPSECAIFGGHCGDIFDLII